MAYAAAPADREHARSNQNG